MKSEAKTKSILKGVKPQRRASFASGVSEASKGSARSKSSKRSGRSRTSSVGSKKKKRGKGRGESGGLVNMGPAPSDNLFQASVSNAASLSVDKYVMHITDPWSAPPIRLPDSVTQPTSCALFLANRTCTTADTDNYPNMLFAMHSNMSVYTTDQVTEAPNTIVNANPTPDLAVAIAPYDYTPGCILEPTKLKNDGASADPLGGSAVGPWSDDYGVQMQQPLRWTAKYRTTAMAIRVRIVGLPTGAFMAPGKIYCAQINWQQDEWPMSEQQFVDLERLGRASHCSLDQVRASGSKTWFMCHDDPAKFNMKSSFLPAAGTISAGDLYGPGFGTQGVRRFFAYTAATAQERFIPYRSAGANVLSGSLAIGDAQDEFNANTTSVLVVGLFGLTNGVVIETDYALSVEAIATKNAPPGIDMRVQLPNSLAMDAISAASYAVAQSRVSAFQARGDLFIAQERAGGGSGHAESKLNGYGKAVSQSVRAAFGRTVPTRYARAEGFFDWLSKASFGDEKTGGISWNFLGKKKKSSKHHDDSD